MREARPVQALVFAGASPRGGLASAGPVGGPVRGQVCLPGAEGLDPAGSGSCAGGPAVPGGLVHVWGPVRVQEVWPSCVTRSLCSGASPFGGPVCASSWWGLGESWGSGSGPRPTRFLQESPVSGGSGHAGAGYLVSLGLVRGFGPGQSVCAWHLGRGSCRGPPCQRGAGSCGLASPGAAQPSTLDASLSAPGRWDPVTPVCRDCRAGHPSSPS